MAELFPQGSPTLRASRRRGCQIIINGTPAGITQKALLIWAELLPAANDCGNLNRVLPSDWLPPFVWSLLFLYLFYEATVPLLHRPAMLLRCCRGCCVENTKKKSLCPPTENKQTWHHAGKRKKKCLSHSSKWSLWVYKTQEISLHHLFSQWLCTVT